MQKLIEYILRNYFFFLFVLLLILSVSIFVRYDAFQQSVFYRLSQSVVGKLFHSQEKVNNYFQLQQMNEKLSDENAQMRAELLKLKQKFSVADELNVKDTSFQFIPCKVISNSTQKTKNYMMLNKGSQDGIEKDMGVISPTGIAGIVVYASENFSWVISVLNEETKVSAKLKKTNQMGTLIWDGKYYDEGLLLDIPAHVKLSKGDTIITSGYSHIFPEGISVGTVKDYKINQGNFFYLINVDYSTDFNALNYAYVVENFHKKEIEKLQKLTHND